MRWLGIASTGYVLTIFLSTLGSVALNPESDINAMRIWIYILLMLHAIAQLFLVNKVHQLLNLPKISADRSLDQALISPHESISLSTFAKALAIVNSVLVLFATAIMSGVLILLMRDYSIFLVVMISALGVASIIFNLTSIFLKRGKPTEDV